MVARSLRARVKGVDAVFGTFRRYREINKAIGAAEKRPPVGVKGGPRVFGP